MNVPLALSWPHLSSFIAAVSIFHRLISHIKSISKHRLSLSFDYQIEELPEMGSLEEEDLVRMVQDFIESESPSPTSSGSSNFHALNHRTQIFILQDILRSQTAAETKVKECVLKHMRGRRDAEKTTSLRKWLVMRLKMDGLNASLCQTSWDTSMRCPAGEYEYIEVIIEDKKGNPTRLIVDTDLQSQFELARPTQYYKELNDSLPVVFVGTEDKLCKIISLLCSAAKQSLREKGLHVPPWRTTAYMQSKWLCVSNKEEIVGRESTNCMGSKGSDIGNKWVPPTPITKSKKRDLSGGSALSSQLSSMSINCC